VTAVSGARTNTPVTATPTSASSQPALGKPGSVRATVSTGSSGTVISAPVTLGGGNTSLSPQAPVSVATFGKPDPFEPGLSSGSLTAGYPIDLPAGPGGLTPQLILSYDSAGVSDQHSPQGAAPWVGEGWNLSMGAISWSEHAVPPPSACNPAQTTCPSWDDTWQLSDAYGTSAELVPPSQQVSTYNDDTTYPQTPSPITWHTAPETHARVISFTSPSPPSGMSPAPPCFRVFLPSGIMEEFGCTPDSLQFYPQTGGPNAGKDYIANWLLDLITDPAGNQIHVTYQSDTETASGVTYPRDTQLATVEYDTPGCLNAQAACTGSSWAPQMRADFLATTAVQHQLGASCAANGSLRCDDPVDLTASSGEGVPLVQSTLVLNDVQVQLRASGTAGWNTLRDYQLSYEQTGPTTIQDPWSANKSESTAGKLDLTQLKTIGADGATALPPHVFSYINDQTTLQYYEDWSGHAPSGNCGPSWNSSQCALWSQSYAGNSSYLASVSNGLGLAESFTWADARSNSSATNQTDPMYCDQSANQGTAPCAGPDNGTWSRMVLASKTDTVNRITQAGQGGTQSTTPVTSTTQYTYQLAPWVAGCSGCVGMYFRSSQDQDLNEFYNGKFMGFAQTSVSNPDGSVAVHHFYAGEGQGIYDVNQVACSVHCGSLPWFDLANAAHMHEYELDSYNTDGTTLLSKVHTTWRALCPPTGVSGTPAVTGSGYGSQWNMLVSELDEGTNPVMVCDVQKLETDTSTYDGTSGQPVHSATSYTYDSYGRAVSQATTGNASAVDSSGHGSQATLMGGVTQPASGLISGNSDTASAFDGSTGLVQLPSGPFGSYPTTGSTTSYALSFEAWFKTTSGGVILGQISGAFSPPDAPYLGGWIPGIYVDTTGAIEERLFWHNGPPLNAAAGPYNDGQPHQVVATYANGVDSLYVDGQLKASQSGDSEVAYLSSGDSADAYSYMLGDGYTGTYPNAPAGWDPFNGTIGEVSVYGGALSATRVQAHFTAGSGYQSAVAADSPTAYWRLNEEAGTASPNTTLSKPAYAQDDAVSATSTSATGHYLVDYPAFNDTEDISGNRYRCSYTSYDGQSFTTGQTSGLTLGELTTQDHYTGCGTSPSFTPSGQIRTTSAYDVFGDMVASSDADANAGVAGHTGCTVGSTAYSACTSFDNTFDVHPTASANALNQTATTGYQPAGATAPAVVQDGGGQGYNGAPGSAVTFGAPGLVTGDPDSAATFNGSSASTVNLDLPSLDTTSGHQVTVEFWLKYSGSGGMPFGFNRYDLLIDSSGFGFNTAVSDNYGVPLSSLPTNTPVHVVAVFGNSSLTANKLYINGVAQTLSQLHGTPQSQTVTRIANISGWGRDGNNRFNGTLGKVAIYNGALSASRVQAHFTAGAGYNAAVLADSPLAFYRLNDTAGSGGFGLWPTSTTDVNGNSTGVTYDALGRETSTTQPVTTIADSSGHGFNGVPTGAIGYGTQGMTYSGDADTAVTFGTTAAPGGVSLNIPTVDTASGHQVTVEFWMQWNGSGTGMPFGFNAYDLRLVPGTGFGFNTANSDLYGVSMSAIPANTPLHVVAVFTNGGVTSNQLYINGVAQTLSQLTGTPQPQSATAAASISSWASNNHYTFPGTLDEVAVYNGALSSTRVQAHFNAGSGYASAVLADSPLAYYHLDEDNRPAAQTSAYTVWCSGTAAQTPCVEVDRTQRLNSTTTTTSRAFYDGLGHLVETRSPAPAGQDVVQYSSYDSSQRQIYQSVPYLVSAYTGAPGSAAFSIPDSTVAGTTTTYDGLGRTLTTTDALSNQSTRSYSVACAAAGTGSDSGCYEQTLATDAKGHRGGTLADALSRIAYVQRYTGSTSPYTLYATAKYTYDFVGDLVKILEPDGSTQTTSAFDMAGRKTSLNDPDLGAQTYTYDQNGNLTESVDARGAAGTIFMGYDGLNRPIWRNTSNSPTGAYDTYAYDSTAGGNVGVGRLTSEAFAVGSLSGSEVYTFDGRGQQTSTTLTVGGTAYPLGSTYDDAGHVLTQSYPDGETITNGYTAQGWLSQVATTQGGTTLASNVAYTGVGGALGDVTGASLGNGTYTYSTTYDLLGRPTDLKTTKTSGGAVMFDQSRTFDAAGNVTTASMTMPGGTDNQSFCYDDQDRLTWASTATATPPCGGSNTAGTLSAASYTQSFAYDVMGRLTSGPLGTYTYGDTAHVHAATAIGSAYTATYDAAGNMTCRAPSSSSTCTGTQTGAQLGYNNESELQAWQNVPSSPTTSSSFLYDGQGQRVEQSVTSGGTTTTTVYVGDVEEVSTTGGTTTTTAYYYLGGKRIGLSVNGTISYLASDGLGSSTVTLSSSGSATAAQLFAPYGSVRYSSGTMPTLYGFTGQRSDTASGLDYYGARYYDPVAGQFTSTDSVLPGGGFDPWGLSRYAYVGGNPEDRTDPTGHINLSVGDDGSSVPIDNSFQGTYSWGGSPVVYHQGFTRSYPTSRSIAQQWPSPPPPPSAAQNQSPPASGLSVGGMLEGVHPAVFVWRHAEALDAAGLVDPFGVIDSIASLKESEGWSGDPDEEDQWIFLFGALMDRDSRAAVLGGLFKSGRIEPDPLAVGPHTVAERDASGRVTQYKLFVPNSRNPSGWDIAKRYDTEGGPHYNKVLRKYVDVPHVHDPTAPGRIRPPLPWENP
jgi:RHS repeat-associated protein